ncbi:MAG: hypothetical protein REI11_18970 [Patulibacter sp.]|nr:hypothetical protein [Patulibacter sp.]
MRPEDGVTGDVLADGLSAASGAMLVIMALLMYPAIYGLGMILLGWLTRTSRHVDTGLIVTWGSVAAFAVALITEGMTR